MKKEYKTILNCYNSQLEINKSIFITNIKRCEKEQESFDFINEISAKYKDATHNCYAFINGETKNVQRYGDDGEPQGTAGIPMLEVLKKEDLTNIAVVVTRYFGGKKLGASGLIRAYSSAVSDVLKISEIIYLKTYYSIKVVFEYSYLGKIDNYIENENFFLKSRQYLEKIDSIYYISIDKFDELKNNLLEITSANIEISILDTLLLQVKDGVVIDN